VAHTPGVFDTHDQETAERLVAYANAARDRIRAARGPEWPDALLEDDYATIAPDLWKLEDSDGDGRSDRRNSLADGFGVHFGYAGHDMSGLTRGPDGKMYWSIGDIGVNTTGPDGRSWKYPNQGVVARANPDGTDFEIFAYGLRNPQELAFDKFGNLISVDNDGDRSGEHERIVYLTEGSDSGWRMNWQFGKYSEPDNSDYVVWMEEGLHKPYFEGQPAYITPPVALYHDGPAGIAYNPGTALNDEWQDHFFVSLFTGSAAQARLHAFELEPDGASFSVKEDRQVLEGVLATGIAFSPDGALYLADWGEGWNIGPKGRVWKLDTPGERRSSIREETEALLGAGMSGRSITELRDLLHHADMRVRMEAQFELAARGNAGREALLAAAQQTTHRLARLHGIWGLGQLGREQSELVEPLLPLLSDSDPEVRSQVAKIMGEVEYTSAAEGLLRLLDDVEARPRFFGAIALGRIGYEEAFEPLVRMIARDGPEDPFLRQAGIVGFTRLNLPERLVELSTHNSETVRSAAAVALRRLSSERVAVFLEDENPRVRAEAARAIHDDFSIPGALSELARVLERDDLTSEALLRRAINANLRIGTPVAAERLASFADRSSAPSLMRAEAIASLTVWPRPSSLDRVTGRFRIVEPRDTSVARRAAETLGPTIWTDPSDTVRVEAAEMVGRLQIPEAAPHLFDMVQDTSSATSVRVAALKALSQLNDDRLPEAVSVALEDSRDRLGRQAIGLLSELDISDAGMASMYERILETGTTGQRQSTLRALGRLESPKARRLLDTWMDRLLENEVDPALQLDLIAAVRDAGSEQLSTKLDRYEASRPDTVLADYRETLYGGDRQAGRQIVFQHSTAQCMRCHTIDGEGGTVGPPLDGFGTTASRTYILESLVRPGEALAPGYGTTTFTLEDGLSASGSVEQETSSFVILETGEGSTRRIRKDDIVRRSTTPSAMPPMDNILSKEQIRDVIEYLAQLD
jgi:putative heme-binding domain-containing protein